MHCESIQTVFTEGEGEAITWVPGAAEALALWFSKRRALDLYIITQCHDDRTEHSVRTLLQQANIRGLNLDVRMAEKDANLGAIFR